ncbi:MULTISPECIES: family 43 glycosylhydrolase [unclassified Mucilaginibacter]|uniref:family 43 glycosylhydrolase n=1 Tax=unclassified Mucilaginibacter TaxID=2617802 RepID=UPI0031F60CB9
MKYIQYWLIVAAALLSAGYVKAQNPLIINQFTADPSARVFNGRVYIYPSHDIKATPGRGREGWFVMEDYHVFSSANLTDWTDHGMIVSQTQVPWADPASFSMWAPDCIFRNGKYYFYFPTTTKPDLPGGKGHFAVGVAVAQRPEGPFRPEAQPIAGVVGIDPNVFIDDDGQAYLYWSQGNIYAAKLKANMLELDGEVKTLTNLPSKGLKEGPYLYKHNNTYYLTYPHVENKIERLEYAISKSPLGPFKFTGVIMDENPTGCWTNHHSIIEFKGQHYLFYHSNDLSPNFDKNRSVRADSLFFNANGTIKKVIPTLRGVGLTQAFTKIQIDRFSDKGSEAGVSFLDSAKRFDGWKCILPATPNGWVKYTHVNFKELKAKKLMVRAWSALGGVLEIRTGTVSGPVIASIPVPQGGQWHEISAPTGLIKPGIQDLVIAAKNSTVEVDWISFK